MYINLTSITPSDQGGNCLSVFTKLSSSVSVCVHLNNIAN